MKIGGLKRFQQKKYFIKWRVCSQILHLLGPGSVVDRPLVLSSFLWLWNFPSPVKGKHDAMINSQIVKGSLEQTTPFSPTARERGEETTVNPELADVCGRETMIVLCGV